MSIWGAEEYRESDDESPGKYADLSLPRGESMRLARCTGCRKTLDFCKCQRGTLNRCAGCAAKLWLNLGRRIWWGIKVRELCPDCYEGLPPHVFVDGGKYARAK
jgi:hypothetical protein